MLIEVAKYINIHWEEWLFAAILALLGFGYRQTVEIQED